MCDNNTYVESYTRGGLIAGFYSIKKNSNNFSPTYGVVSLLVTS